MWDINFLIPKINTNILIIWRAWTWKTTLINKFDIKNIIVSLNQYSSEEDIIKWYEKLLNSTSWIVILDEVNSIFKFLSEEQQTKILNLIKSSTENEINLKFIISINQRDSFYENLSWIHILTDVIREKNKLRYQKTVIFKN